MQKYESKLEQIGSMIGKNIMSNVAAMGRIAEATASNHVVNETNPKTPKPRVVEN